LRLPKYQEPGECEVCGASVSLQERHYEWHRAHPEPECAADNCAGQAVAGIYCVPHWQQAVAEQER
jgi:hypothetical protein